MNNKKYICEYCEKEFTSSNSLNAHKRSCQLYKMAILGDAYPEYLKKYKNTCSQTSFKAAETRRKKVEEKQKQNLEQWIAEQHHCEKCNKIMITKFGSGRFCSRACANSRNKTDDVKRKTSITLLKRNNPELNDSEINSLHNYLLDKNKKTHKVIYKGPKLPTLKIEKQSKGYPSRNKIPYSEQFWKKVLENNNVDFQMGVDVWKPGLNNYHLDFLVGNVDIEIDGQLHELPECIEKDKRRTEWLESQGYIVYRIKWINPNTEKNKVLVNQQIQDLFDFLNIERIN